MAHAAVLGKQRRATTRIGGDGWGLTDAISAGQGRGQLPGLQRNLAAVDTLLNALAQTGNALLQLGLLVTRWQRNDQPLQYSKKLKLLTVLTGVDHLTIGHGGRVVSAQVTEQMQRLRRAVNGLGHNSQAAECQHRHQQPAAET